LFDLGVRIEHALTAEQLNAVEKMAAWADRRVDLQSVLDACQKVVRTVTGGCVNGAGALLERDVIAEYGHGGAIV
jgi:hypothetical protein